MEVYALASENEIPDACIWKEGCNDIVGGEGGTWEP